jgi:ribosomal protein S6
MYELFIAFPEEGSAPKTEKNLESLKKSLLEPGGKILKTADLGIRQFAYPIIRKGRRHLQGHFFDLYFELKDKEKLKDLQNELRLKSELLRFFIAKYDQLPQETLPGKKESAKTTIATEPKKPSAVKPAVKAAKAAPAKKKTSAAAARPSEKKKAKLEDIDKKLDEILEKTP